MSLMLIAMTFFILLFCTLALKKSLLVSAAIGLIGVIIMISFTSGIEINNIIGAFVNGLLVAIEITLLVFGALCFYNFLKAGGFIQKLEQSLEQFSTNKLVIAILLTIFFGYFIEGVSGFGTPAMIIAPLLLGLRFPVYLAASLPLLANTVPVIFGAVGTPIKIGFAELPVEQTPFYAAILMLLPVLVIPVIFKAFLTSDELLPKKMKNDKVNFITVMAGISFGIPFVLLARLGPEFPDMIAAITGLGIWLLMLKISNGSLAVVNTATLSGFYKTFKPYLLIALLLLFAKLTIGNIHFTINWPEFGLAKNISLFQPGLIFLAGLLLLFFFDKKMKAITLRSIYKQTAQPIPKTFATIAILAILAKLLSQNLDITSLFVQGSINPSLFYPMAIATGFLGSFISGSATVSNLMFGNEWFEAGQQIQLNIPLLLASQLAGAALGNALSVQNIVMVQAVLNEKELQSSVIKKLWKPLLLLFILSGISTYILRVLIGH